MYFSLLATLSILASCSIQKRAYDVPQNMEQNNVKLSSTSFDSLGMATAEPISEWWQNFNDPKLDTLISMAQRNNRNIWVAVANYNAAKAIYRNRRIDRFPELNVNGGYTRTRLGENIFVPGFNPTYSQYDAFFSSSWELDFFGRTSNRAKGALANQQLSLAEVNQTYLVITSEVARTYFNLLGLENRIQLTKKNLKEREQAYELTTRLSESGLGNDLDVSRASAQVEQTKSLLLLLASEKDMAENYLYTLIGSTDFELDVDLMKLPNVPEAVPTGDLYTLIRNRPDVLAAESNVKLRIANYNIAVADLYPSISINGNVGFSAIDPANFGSNPSFAWAFMPKLTWAGLNLGRVKQKIKSEDALTLAALAQYEQTVLNAFEELKNNWVLMGNEMARQESLKNVFEQSNKAAVLAKQRYNAGIDDFFDYLLANESLLSAENELVQNQQNVLAYYVNLYKAMGMGWQGLSEESLDDQFEQIKTNLEPSN